MYPNLKFQIWRSGMRQNRLAQILELDETTLSRIVNGFRKPGPEMKARIAAALRSDERWLFEEADQHAEGNSEILARKSEAV